MTPATRSLVTCRDNSSRFVLPATKEFTQQYSHIYLQRLTGLRPALEVESKATWPGVSIIDKVISLQPNQPSCVVIGTLYKEQKLKPSVMDSFVEEFDGNVRKEDVENFASKDDSLLLEDESGRLNIMGLDSAFIATMVTGIVVALKGSLDVKGFLQVEGVCYPGMLPQAPLRKYNESHRYVALVCGLSVGGPQDQLKMQLLMSYLAGHAGDDEEHMRQKDIVRLIICGASTAGKSTSSEMAAALTQLDASLAELATSLPVDILPGGLGDACTLTLPQQPLHKCLFMNSSRFTETFRRTTNPYECWMDDERVMFFGHSGSPTSDILRCTAGLTSTLVMERTLKWRICAPTAPDTIPSFPFKSCDPFIMEKRPHVYFSGNQTQYESLLVKDTQGVTRCISVPSFADTGLVVLVDIDSDDFTTSTLTFQGLN